jgi:hypothetical protein
VHPDTHVCVPVFFSPPFFQPYTRKLESLCTRKFIPLPAKPEGSWTTPAEELFRPKLKAYPNLSESAVEADAAEAAHDSWEVERILNMKFIDGIKYYQVKWKVSGTGEDEKPKLSARR